MKSKGSPLPIPILGDDLKRVSDTNPCHKTGVGPVWYLRGGTTSRSFALIVMTLLNVLDDFEIYCSTPGSNPVDMASRE